MNESENQLFTKKNIITFLLLGILVLAIPIAVILVQKQQELRSRAAGEVVTFSGDGVACDSSGCKTNSSTVDITFNSPYGAFGTPAPTATPAPPTNTPGPNTPTAIPPTGTPIPPTATPTPQPFGGYVESITGNLAVGNQINFTAIANDYHTPSWLAKGDVLIAHGDGTQMDKSECSVIAGGSWCNVGTTGLIGQGNSPRFSGAWTPKTAGDYYVAVNVGTRSTELVGGDRIWCSGNPWCKYQGQSSCAAGGACVDCSTILSCGGAAYRKFHVN